MTESTKYLMCEGCCGSGVETVTEEVKSSQISTAWHCQQLQKHVTWLGFFTRKIGWAILFTITLNNAKGGLMA